jgi:hypothetical protein
MWNVKSKKLEGMIENSEVEATGLQRFDFEQCVGMLGRKLLVLAELDLTDGL